jgi:nitric oxide reductase NorD protein
MAFVTKRNSPQNRILSLFPLPLYTHSGIYYEEDLEELGLEKALEPFPRETAEELIEQARKLASIQPELAFHFFMNLPRLLEVVKWEDLDKWVSVVLDIYDSRGLNPARQYIQEMDKHPDFPRFWGKGLSYREVCGILLNYLHGLGKRELTVEEGDAHYTDMVTVYLPKRLSLFGEAELNFLLYKVMVTHKFAQLHLGTYLFRLTREGDLVDLLKRRYGLPPDGSISSDLSRFLHLFPDPTLAGDLFHLADTVRIEGWIARTLPGLHRELEPLKRGLAEKREGVEGLSPQNQVVEGLIRWWLKGRITPTGPESRFGMIEGVGKKMAQGIGPETTAEDLARITTEIYDRVARLPGPYIESAPIPYAGELRPEEAELGRRRRRESLRLEFRQEMAEIIKEIPEGEETRIEIPEMEKGTPGGQIPRRQEIPKELLINGNPLPIPPSMKRTIQQIYEDLGSIPTPYLAVTDDMSGHFFRPLCRMPEGTGYVLSEQDENIHALHEWDYRRQGYRKQWALLREIEAPDGGLPAAREILDRHRGMVRQIRQGFERIRMDETLLRRRKEGDGIDLDAAIEAFSDQRAGLSPSEQVFVRLQRNRRDIAAAFLIDLSGSTSGWINEMEKAALLILGEAMQVLQDRFAIYGFSGRTRKRCELFRIKGLDEPYGDAVRGRIGNLSPREYTRLGPPIRYLTKMLGGMEAKTRLLITLSDGKPDDWDGYNGDYGIEDTRQALIEAKRSAVHPFCITIDKAEHRYLARMFGALNYVFIDNLSKLPFKIPEIYRRLTT